jgi:hypothetical protein
VIGYNGRWRITVIGKQSDWDQRVVIAGAASGSGVIAGVVGASGEVEGDNWTLTIEHDDGSGWQENEGLLPDPMLEIGAEMSQTIRSKDHYTAGDAEPNDLVIRVDKIGPMFELPARPYAVDADSLLMLADGVFVGLTGPQYMGVEVRNTWGETFEDELLFDISDLGRATLASFGIAVNDTWSQAALLTTQQTLSGRAIRLPPLAVGESTTVYFQVDAAGARRGKPEVEFILLNVGGTPDPVNRMRYNSRAVFIADLSYDAGTGQAAVRIPEGTLTLRLQSMMVDQQAVTRLCRKLTAGRESGGGARPDGSTDLHRLLTLARSTRCDQRMLREIVDILCRCLCDCECGKGPGGPGGVGGGGGHGWPRVCLPGGIWLPLRFEYGIEVDGGFVGQYGPVPFQDPWWKILLLIIALIAWLVGAITQIVADHTGWENSGDHPRKIGTVGASNRTITDACIIELDGSRPAIQKVADVISGETNNNPIIGVDTVIPIDPQVAFPTLTSAAVVGKKVYKSGSRTGLTHGIITSFGAFTQTRSSDGPSHPDLTFANPQFSINADPAFGEELFDDHGDSGSPVLSREPDSMNQVVGLLHSGNGGTSPIQDVLSTLGLRLA